LLPPRITYAANGTVSFGSLAVPGAHVTFSYSGGMLTGITDHKSGRQVSYEYSGDLLARSTDAGGRVTTYTYTGGFLTDIDDSTGRRVLTLTYSDDDYPGSAVYTKMTQMQYGAVRSFSNGLFFVLIDDRGVDLA